MMLTAALFVTHKPAMKLPDVIILQMLFLTFGGPICLNYQRNVFRTLQQGIRDENVGHDDHGCKVRSTLY